METHILEINLISAQGLKPPSSKLGRLKTYAVAWVDSATKLRTRLDRVGSENPTWNDKFLFRVTPQFLASETSGVTVEIYAVGYIRDYLIGSVRLLVSNFLPGGAAASTLKTPSFTALQIRRPSGRFHGVLNVGVMVIKDSDFPCLDGIWAIGHRDLMGGHGRRHRSNSSEASVESGENGGAECSDADSTTSSMASASSTSSPAKATALREWNGGGVRRKSGSNGKFLCGLLPQMKMGSCPSDQKMVIPSGPTKMGMGKMDDDRRL